MQVSFHFTQQPQKALAGNLVIMQLFTYNGFIKMLHPFKNIPFTKDMAVLVKQSNKRLNIDNARVPHECVTGQAVTRPQNLLTVTVKDDGSRFERI